MLENQISACSHTYPRGSSVGGGGGVLIWNSNEVTEVQQAPWGR